MRQEYVQNLSVVALCSTVEDAWSFLAEFGSNFSFTEIVSQEFHAYPKFADAYLFDWILIAAEIATARTKIKECFGNGWTECGGDEIWNAENKTKLSVPTWANLHEPNSYFSVAEARQLDPTPRLKPAPDFFSVSTTGQVMGSCGISPD
jgi:hypothetical protein